MNFDQGFYLLKQMGHYLGDYTQPAYRRAFGELLLRCADAIRDIEAVDDGERAKGDDKEAIMRCIRDADLLTCSLEMAFLANEDLRSTMEEVLKKHGDEAREKLTDLIKRKGCQK